MSFNRRFALFIIAYGIGFLVNQINYDASYEVRIFAVALMVAVGFQLFNTLFNRWTVEQGDIPQ